MAAPAGTLTPDATGLARIFAWPRLKFTLAFSGAVGVLMALSSDTPFLIVLVRALLIGIAILWAYGFFERWPKRLFRWLPRTVWRLVAIAITIPFAANLSCGLTGGHEVTVSGGK